MQYIYLFIQIVFGFFAIFGIYEFAKKLTDAYIIRRSGLKCRFLIENVKGDAEYALRFIESRFLYGDYTNLFSGVTLLEKIDITPETYEKLNKEFKNIYKY